MLEWSAVDDDVETLRLKTAAHFGVQPTGNARAWEYADQPLVRMRNTFIRPGTQSLEEIIASTEDGYLLDGPRNGQADATGEGAHGISSLAGHDGRRDDGRPGDGRSNSRDRFAGFNFLVR